MSVFVSYSRKDLGFVEPFVAALKERGVRVWWDRDIPPGSNWDQELEAALDVCEQVLIVLSPDSTESAQVCSELEFAVARKKPVVPVMFRDTKLPWRLRLRQWIDFRSRRADDPEGLGTILEALHPPGSLEEQIAAYRNAVVSQHQNLFPGLTERFGADVDLLDRLYVELLLEGPGADSEPKRIGFADIVSLQNRAGARRWLVKGDPGSGKTTALRRLASDLARQEKSLPFYRNLRPESWPRGPAGRLLGFDEMLDELPPWKAQVLRHFEASGGLVLLLDGLDECPDRGHVREFLADLLQRLSPGGPTIIVATRPIQYLDALPAGFETASVCGLSRAQRREFLERWFDLARQPRTEVRELLARIDRNNELRHMSEVPLFLTLMALLWADDRSQVGGSRLEFYARVFDHLLAGKHRSPPTAVDNPERARAALRLLSLFYSRSLSQEVSESDMTSFLRNPRDRDVVRWLSPELEDDLRQTAEEIQADGGPGRLLENLSARSQILNRSPDSTRWSFWHRSFAEALVAEQLAELYDRVRGQDPKKALGRVLVFASRVVGAHRPERPARRIAEWVRDAVARITATDRKADAADRDAAFVRTWGEPFALLASHLRGDDRDAWIQRLRAIHPPLGYRALAAAEGIKLQRHVRPGGVVVADWMAQIHAIEETLGKSSPQGAVMILHRWVGETKRRGELAYADWRLAQLEQRSDVHRAAAGRARAEILEKLPASPGAAPFRWVQMEDAQDTLWSQVAPARYVMGSRAEEVGHRSDEKPVSVTITRPFWIMTVPVTRQLYWLFDSGRREYLEGWPLEDDSLGLEDWPIAGITWFEARLYAHWLSRRLSVRARLPSEAEWELACRGGRSTDGKVTRANVDRDAWHRGNCDGDPQCPRTR